MYKKGFNHAYALSKESPDMLKGLKMPENTSSDYIQGLRDGSKQFERERLQMDIKKQQNQDRDQNRNR